ncbi:hypothetical protein CONCODRAFT_8945 [Conidiobolus coronatus NRRL 28638]|uniref:Uncharacterized protein n=1 Tax=Conidiobolus coronatus (strain ATCC 28846 / CBS 209.66 / NRRL 28638) TaxID=796925 RepID=A0A137P0Z9_CONC2|nr:hypothetical protein CONCODRAFT_8945 [Conidiobolus coronatus NRRL 28638]|eukprot:KXN68735.1 hypothetical protein CONCODRAFT_8945 [Conidiobolus coronatus NRRL 28638]
MSPIKYSINNFSSSRSSDLQIFGLDKLHHYTIQFPLLSKPRLISNEGECLCRVYNDHSNAFLRYIGLQKSNQIFTIKLVPELGECLFEPLNRDASANKVQFSWKLLKDQHALHLIDTSSGQLVAKVECSAKGFELATIQFYRVLDEQLSLALIFSGCILLNQSKLLKLASKKSSGLSKSNTI